jgi:hypothetical protein
MWASYGWVRFQGWYSVPGNGNNVTSPLAGVTVTVDYQPTVVGTKVQTQSINQGDGVDTQSLEFSSTAAAHAQGPWNPIQRLGIHPLEVGDPPIPHRPTGS